MSDQTLSQARAEPTRWRLARESLAPARARTYVAEHCADWPRDAFDAAMLLTTELVTNALFHAFGDLWLDILEEPGHITVGVTDSGGGEVHLASPFRWPEGGHGLRLVATLSDRWGVEPVDPGGSGKRVWFEMVSSGSRGSLSEGPSHE